MAHSDGQRRSRRNAQRTPRARVEGGNVGTCQTLTLLRAKVRLSGQYRELDPGLRAAWDAATVYRDAIWQKSKRPTPLRKQDRALFVAEGGEQLTKSALNSAFRRFFNTAVAEGAIDESERFSMHGLTRRGITDTAGTRADKQEASGHRSASMMDT